MDELQDRFFLSVSEETALPVEQAGVFSSYILKELVKRLPYEDAADLIAQLPESLQDELLDLPAKPNVSVNRATILEGVTRLLNIERSVAEDLLKKFWKGLGKTSSAKEVDHVLSRLPEDLRYLFTDRASNLGSPSSL